MTDIQNEVYRIADNVAKAFLSVADKGGTVIAGNNSDSLETAIRSIPTSSGMYVFYISNDGHLRCAYDTLEEPRYSIDENGHLLYEYQKAAPPLEIDGNGHLAWSLEG